MKPQATADSGVQLKSALVVLLLQIVQALDGVFRGGVLQGGEHIGRMESCVRTVGSGNTDYGKTIINGVERTAA